MQCSRNFRNHAIKFILNQAKLTFHGSLTLFFDNSVVPIGVLVVVIFLHTSVANIRLLYSKNKLLPTLAIQVYHHLIKISSILRGSSLPYHQIEI